MKSQLVIKTTICQLSDCLCACCMCMDGQTRRDKTCPWLIMSWKAILFIFVFIIDVIIIVALIY